MPGTITFRPVEANLTHDTDWLGKMDPYCMFTVGSHKAKSQACKHGGTRPHWEDSVTVPAEGNQSICLLDIMDKDKLRPDDSIASAEIDLNEIQSCGRVSRWYPVYHHKKLAGEILLEAVCEPTQQQFAQQPIISQTVIPTATVIPTQTFVEASPPIITTSYTEYKQGVPLGTGVPLSTRLEQQQFIGQGYEIPTSSLGTQSFGQGLPLSGQGLLGQEQFIGQSYGTSSNFIDQSFGQGQNLSGLGGLGSLGGIGTQMPSDLSNQGFSGLSQGQSLEGKTQGYYNASNAGFMGSNAGLQGSNVGLRGSNAGLIGGTSGLQGSNAGLMGSNAGLMSGNSGLLASKTSALGPQGGISHGNPTLKGATNAGYSERPGYTLGDVEANPTTQSNLDTNGGGLFNKPGREKRAEPYSLSNPGTYGIPHGQTVDTAGHLHPEVGLQRQAPIGQINHPGYTGYPDAYNSNLSGGLGQNPGSGLQSNLSQGGLQPNLSQGGSYQPNLGQGGLSGSGNI